MNDAMTPDLDGAIDRLEATALDVIARKEAYRVRAQNAEAVLAKLRTTMPEAVEIAEAMVRQERGE